MQCHVRIAERGRFGLGTAGSRRLAGEERIASAGQGWHVLGQEGQFASRKTLRGQRPLIGANHHIAHVAIVLGQHDQIGARPEEVLKTSTAARSFTSIGLGEVARAASAATSNCRDIASASAA